MKLPRREFLPLAAAALIARPTASAERRMFDSHFHIIDPRFPLVPNQGYTPPAFPLTEYLEQAKLLGVIAGAVVSGSFQANDQIYMIDTLGRLGAGCWQRAVTQSAAGTLSFMSMPHPWRRTLIACRSCRKL